MGLYQCGHLCTIIGLYHNGSVPLCPVSEGRMKGSGGGHVALCLCLLVSQGLVGVDNLVRFLFVCCTVHMSRIFLWFRVGCFSIGFQERVVEPLF